MLVRFARLGSQSHTLYKILDAPMSTRLSRVLNSHETDACMRSGHRGARNIVKETLEPIGG